MLSFLVYSYGVGGCEGPFVTIQAGVAYFALGYAKFILGH